MKLSVVGCGYLGAVHAAAMAQLGHDVVGYDVDRDKVAQLNHGQAPFFEPGFPELLAETLASGRLTFTTDPSELASCTLHFIAVGTPQVDGGYAANLDYINQAVATISDHLHTDAPVVIAGKSTVPVGTASTLETAFKDAAARTGAQVSLAWNPEFLREGFAVNDTLHPDRIVYGLSDDTDDATIAQHCLDECYRRLLDEGIPRLVMNHPTAELVKVAANSFLATKISFINAMSELCEATGADVTKLATAIGHDDRIGSKFLRAGIGFGGGCLPKDIRAFMARASELGLGDTLNFLNEVDSINLRRRNHAAELAVELCGGSIDRVKVTVLGATFKPNSDDLRDSPAIAIAQTLVDWGAQVTITDPAGVANVQARYPQFRATESLDEALRGAQVVLLLTEWKDYQDLDPVWARSLVAEPKMVDGRNVLDPQAWVDAGWQFRAMGRPTPTPRREQ